MPQNGYGRWLKWNFFGSFKTKLMSNKERKCECYEVNARREFNGCRE
jgi:hypothetical protein